MFEYSVRFKQPIIIDCIICISHNGIVKFVIAAGRFRNPTGDVCREHPTNTYHSGRFPTSRTNCFKSKNVRTFSECYRNLYF